MSSYKKTYDEKLINDFFVEIYNRILILEEKWLREQNLQITMSEAHMLVAVGQRENKAMSEVAEAVSLTNGSVTTMIKKLESKGYVMRTRDGADKRILRVRLTDKGKEVTIIHENFHKKLTEAILNSISQEEKIVLTSTIEKIHRFFSDLR